MSAILSKPLSGWFLGHAALWLGLGYDGDQDASDPPVLDVADLEPPAVEVDGVTAHRQPVTSVA